ncbi:MAG TPA: oxidoreductase, partial [Clostridiales bacterium]|nr:oxidoreductase [Clostridiales bacterium]
MKTDSVIVGPNVFKVRQLNTVIVGSGAAGLNAADCLFNKGVTDIALVTEGMNMGTSRNTGSDKQTYYKLSTGGDVPDSPLEMAKDLMDGGSMHGDIALTEAASSFRGFAKLIDLGVPF